MNRRGPRDVPDGLLTREQAAARLGVSVRTFYTLRHEGSLPAGAEVRLPTDRQRVFYDPAILDTMTRPVSGSSGRGQGNRQNWPKGHALSGGNPPPRSRSSKSGRPLW